jgi:hypothetical protein
MKLSTSNRGSEAEDTKKKGCTDESPICHRLANLINLRAIPATSIKYLYRIFNLDVPRTLYEINSAVAPYQAICVTGICMPVSTYSQSTCLNMLTSLLSNEDTKLLTSYSTDMGLLF